MTEEEIKIFFNVNVNNEKSYLAVRNVFSDEEVLNHPEKLIAEILKQTYGYPISFMDEAMEELVHISEEKSLKVYENYAQEIVKGYYENLYDFTQELSDCLGNFPG
ncbi:hypothetical protein [Treponema sp.]|uniref:hypothetical protein n=1 Tax=Treponema sp. TaxID=166 RepID=UPI0038907E6B